MVYQVLPTFTLLAVNLRLLRATFPGQCLTIAGQFLAQATVP